MVDALSAAGLLPLLVPLLARWERDYKYGHMMLASPELRARAAAGPMRFTTPNGWAVELDQALIALGPFYFNAFPPDTQNFRSGTVIVEATEQVLSGELDPNAARVAIDALKWTAARMHPTVYSEKHAIELSGPNGGPITYGWGDNAPKV